MDAAELLANLEEEIVTAKGEVASRKDIMNLMEKWMSACEEEGWLEDYNKVLEFHSIGFKDVFISMAHGNSLFKRLDFSSFLFPP